MKKITMPLLVDNKRIDTLPPNAEDFLSTCDTLKKASNDLKSLAAAEVQEVGPVGLLYVNQREFAVVPPNTNNIDILGSDDATTCHIMVIRHSSSRVTGLAHLDGSSTKEAILNMIAKCQKLHLKLGAPEGRFDVHLVGGFVDDRYLSQQLTAEILGTLINDVKEEIHLITACISDLNDHIVKMAHHPVILGLAVEVKTGRIFPAQFKDKGPDIALRSAVHFIPRKSTQVVDIFDSSDKEFLVIGPFEWSAKEVEQIVRFIKARDQVIRTVLSTSPEQEPLHFAESVRAALTVLRDHHSENSLFQDNQPRRYVKQSDGSWELQPYFDNEQEDEDDGGSQ